jgi:2-polyprenyl-3-methyl-5-hydroxy-6-metoxy-1,4-benzoquinol methylase
MRGGTNEARLYLNDLDSHGILRTNMSNMNDLIARHKARYHLGAFLARPDMKVLDFPCGSGYGAEIIDNVEYIGMDIDQDTIHYARNFYPFASFDVNDLTNPKDIGENYDLILCIEGLEHIGMQYQEPLVETFYNALKPGGRLLVSMPEAPDQSGPSPDNKYHLWELSFMHFHTMLWNRFDTGVQIINHEDTLHNGVKSNCLYGICLRGNND